GTQIWFVSYPDGVAQRITNDLNGYGTISLGLTTDSKIIATVQEDMTRSISVIEANGQADQARPISNGKYEGMFSLATAPDGRILYLEPAGDSTEIWIMKADGSDRKQLTNDGAIKDQASISADAVTSFSLPIAQGISASGAWISMAATRSS